MNWWYCRFCDNELANIYVAFWAYVLTSDFNSTAYFLCLFSSPNGCSLSPLSNPDGRLWLFIRSTTTEKAGWSVKSCEGNLIKASLHIPQTSAKIMLLLRRYKDCNIVTTSFQGKVIRKLNHKQNMFEGINHLKYFSSIVTSFSNGVTSMTLLCREPYPILSFFLSRTAFWRHRPTQSQLAVVVYASPQNAAGNLLSSKQPTHLVSSDLISLVYDALLLVSASFTVC